MAYATVDELAVALHITVTPANTAALQRCLDAAAAEIDAAIDWVTPPGAPTGNHLALVKSENILRGVEWWKSNDAAFGVLGFADTGALRLPQSTFIRHRLALRPVKEQFGIG